MGGEVWRLTAKKMPSWAETRLEVRCAAMMYERIAMQERLLSNPSQTDVFKVMICEIEFVEISGDPSNSISGQL